MDIQRVHIYSMCILCSNTCYVVCINIYSMYEYGYILCVHICSLYILFINTSAMSNVSISFLCVYLQDITLQFMWASIVCFCVYVYSNMYTRTLTRTRTHTHTHTYAHVRIYKGKRKRNVALHVCSNSCMFVPIVCIYAK